MGTLELRHELGGMRHYLDVEPVHAGDNIELVLPDGRGIVGRYEWNFRAGDDPSFYFDVESGSRSEPAVAVLAIPKRAVFRWPGREP